MERITITIDDGLLRLIDDLAKRRGYPSRSEAIRTLVRDAANHDKAATGSGDCYATLSYVYDHATRALAERLINQQHEHHDLGIATTHVHVDHDTCLEVAILKGPIPQIRDFADELTVQRGVRHAALHIIPAHADSVEHAHTHRHRSHHGHDAV